MEKIGFLSTMVVASCIVLLTGGAEAGWRPSARNWGDAIRHGGGAIQDARRNNPFGAVDHLLRIPSPTNPYRYFPKPMQDRIMRDFRMVDPAQRYGPEFRPFPLTRLFSMAWVSIQSARAITFVFARAFLN